MPYDDLSKLSNKKDEIKLNPSMSLDELLEQTKDINMILDHIEEKAQKHLEEELKKIDVKYNIYNF